MSTDSLRQAQLTLEDEMASTGRKAARIGAQTTCMTHDSGEVSQGKYTVVVEGLAAACMGTGVLCEGGVPGVVLFGDPTVLAEGTPMARQFELAAHVGLIVSGAHNVEIGTPTDDEWIALSILRIKLSQFGQTETGKAIVAQLEKMQAEGKISFGPTHNDDAQYDGADRSITVSDNDRGNVDATASDLTHEGTHAYDDRNRPDGTVPPSSHDNPEREYPAFDNESELYKEQSSQGYYNQDLHDLRNPATRRKTIDQRYGYGGSGR
jgi:uncharacterized Zn-binding protein involved in type VI secretion